jgi:hypothetical protein
VLYQFRLKNQEPEFELSSDEQIRKNWGGTLDSDPTLLQRAIKGSDFTLGDGKSDWDFLFDML